MRAVVDASVLVRTVVPGEHTDVSRQWIATVQELPAPRLLWFEVTSTLRRLEYMKVIDEEAADQGLEQLLRLPITLFGRKSMYQRSVQLARELNVARTYDMAYLALAVEKNCVLVTLDGRLIRNARSRGYDVQHPADVINSHINQSLTP